MNVGKIAANILVGPMEEPYMLCALGSVKWVDEVVVVVNNVTDNNRKLLDQFQMEYGGIYKEVDYYNTYDRFNFAQARNLGIENSFSDYILKIDADEVYFDSFEETVRNKVLRQEYDVYKVKFIHMFFSLEQYRFIEPKEVIFKNSKDIRWKYDVHEHLSGYSSACQLEDLFMHLGYIKPPEEVLKKWKLYAKLEDKEGMFDHLDGDQTFLQDVKIFNYTSKYPEEMERRGLI